MPGKVGKSQVGRKNKMENIYKNFPASAYHPSMCKRCAEQDWVVTTFFHGLQAAGPDMRKPPLDPRVLTYVWRFSPANVDTDSGKKVTGESGRRLASVKFEV